MIVNGKEEILRLSLNALADLERRLETKTISDFISSFEKGTFTANELVAILSAAYFGANHRHINFSEASIEGGIKEAVEAASKLLIYAFVGYQNAKHD